MPIEKKGQLHSDILSKQKQLWVQALTEKRKHIQAAKKYAAQQDTSWWDVFFSDQNELSTIVYLVIIGLWKHNSHGHYNMIV